MNEAQRQARRREVCRRNQQRYRERMVQKEKLLSLNVRVIQEQIVRVSLWHGLLARGTVLKPVHRMELRRTLAEMFCDYVRFGIHPIEHPVDYRKAARFIGCTFTPDCVLLGTEVECGAEMMLKQWVLYSCLYGRFFITKHRIDHAFVDMPIVRQRVNVELTVVHHTISKLYPALVYNFEFLQASIGKVLEFEQIHTYYFNDRHQIERIQIESGLGMAQAWAQLLKQEHRLIRAVMEAQRIYHHYVKVDDESVLNLVACPSRQPMPSIVEL